MARVDLWTSDLTPERLPPTCVKSGQPATGSAKVKFVTAPAWVWLFLAGGLIAVLPIWLLTRRVAQGRLPMAAHVRNRLRLLKWSATGLMISAGIVLLIGLTANLSWDGNLLVLGLSAFSMVAGLVVKYVVVPMAGIRGKVYEDDTQGRTYVRLSGVHPNFASAVAQMYGQPSIPPQAAA